MKKTVFFTTAVIGMVLAAGLWAADIPPFPDWGADAVPDLYAPNLAGPGAFSTTTGGAPASAINPAQGGTAQRIVFDLGYLGITGLGEEEGYGNAAEFGMMVPTRYGVFGGSVRFIESPFCDSFPVKWAFSGNLNAAKEIYPKVSVGAGLNFGVGEDWIWTLSGDIGYWWNMGKIGPFENFTTAAILRSMGISWTPTWFTPVFGLAMDLVRVKSKAGKSDPFVLKASSDISLPSIVYFPRTSLILKAGLGITIADLVDISLSWPGGSGLNARELADGGTFPAIPSVGIGFNINLPSGGARLAGGRLPSDGELSLDLAYKPLYEGVTALGGGATWTVGIADKKPPAIIIDYPTEEDTPAEAPQSAEEAQPAETAQATIRMFQIGQSQEGAAYSATMENSAEAPRPARPSYPVYFSPNNDGKADYLEFSFSIADERYVDSWEWEIRDEANTIVRTYRNKELRPVAPTLKNFFQRLFAVKTQVEVPQTLRWDGIGDSGELVPDGRYFFTISAADDSGNKVTTRPYETVIDNTPPEIAIEAMDEADRVFSPGGGGAKNTITIKPSGSPEDSWESGIYDSTGNKVRSFASRRGSPGPQVWDGRGDSGAIVRDGVYTYRIEATDRALNYGSAVLGNIVVNTIRPRVNVVIADPWFSPNGDGMKDTLIMSLTVPVKEEVIGWTITIMNRQGVKRRTFTGGQGGGVGASWNAAQPGSALVSDQFHFDGRDDNWTVLPEGEYTAQLSVNYLNGFTSTAVSPVFTLDITPPTAAVSSNFVAFSPTHGGVQSEMLIAQEGSRELVWTGEIRRAVGIVGERPVRSFRFNGVPSSQVRWDGQGESGTFASDGEYIYQLTATDQAGNTGRSNALRFRLSTADTPVMITTDARAFAPGGNGTRNTINLNPQVQVKEGILTYKVTVQDSKGGAVRTFEGRGAPPAAINWNGRTGDNTPAAEGMYTARLELRYEQGNQPTATSLPFELDITPPKATVSAQYTVFSPNGRRNTLPLNVTTEASDEWEAAITGAGGQSVRTWNWTGAAPRIWWDGKDAAGNAAPDGTYQFTLQSTDAAGNNARFTIPNIVLDARVPQLILTASATGIAPKPNQSADLVRFGVICQLREGIENWTLELKDEKGAVLRRFASPAPGANGTVAAPPATIGWNGLSDGGAVREGRFTPVLTVSYVKGDLITAETASILVNVTGPQLSFSYRPQYFSPDNDGVEDVLYMSLGAKSVSPIESWSLEIREPVAPYLLFYRITGRGNPAETVTWDGRSNSKREVELVQSATDYPVKFTVTDALGNTSTLDSQIGVDVLVIRDGDRLRILVPSIVFRENAADFNGIPADRRDNNMRVLRRIAEILNKFRDYKVLVEGHANPVLLTAKEEREELQPLSEARARAVVNMLIEFGVARARLSSVGMGGTRTVVRHADHDNWWKNRRVEFILIK